MAEEFFTRDRVERVIRRTGIPADDADRLLNGLHYPARRADVEAAFLHVGLTLDGLISRLGGSP